MLGYRGDHVTGMMRPIVTLRNKGIAPAMLKVGLIVFGVLVALGQQSWWEEGSIECYYDD